MALMFSLDKVDTVEFGIGIDSENGRVFFQVPVNAEVQSALREMAQTTWDKLSKTEDGPATYEPGEKHGQEEYLVLAIDEDLAVAMRELHEAVNLLVNTAVLSEPSNVYSYFAKFTDADGQRLTAVHRATQFKGVLRARLLKVFDDTLTLVPDKVFKLDNDFDLLIDEQSVHILRPSSFEFAGQLQQAILQAVPSNVRGLSHDLPYLDLADVAKYAATHPRAARYLASIRSQEDLGRVNKDKRLDVCRRFGVGVQEEQGMVRVSEADALSFLEVLDRRRFELELIDGQAELYRAPSRQRLK